MIMVQARHMKNTRTLDYYEQNSEQFIHDTVSANRSETCGFFLSAIKEEHPLEDNSELIIMENCTASLIRVAAV